MALQFICSAIAKELKKQQQQQQSQILSSFQRIPPSFRMKSKDLNLALVSTPHCHSLTSSPTIFSLAYSAELSWPA